MSLIVLVAVCKTLLPLNSWPWLSVMLYKILSTSSFKNTWLAFSNNRISLGALPKIVKNCETFCAELNKSASISFSNRPMANLNKSVLSINISSSNNGINQLSNLLRNEACCFCIYLVLTLLNYFFIYLLTLLNVSFIYLLALHILALFNF